MFQTAICRRRRVSSSCRASPPGTEIHFGGSGVGHALAIAPLGYASGMRAVPILFALVAFLAIAVTAFLLVAGWMD